MRGRSGDLGTGGIHRLPCGTARGRGRGPGVAMAASPVPGFNFRILFSAPLQESAALDSGDALAAATAQAAQIVPSAPAATIKAGFAEVSGLNAEIEIEEYREGGRNIGAR